MEKKKKAAIGLGITMAGVGGTLILSKYLQARPKAEPPPPPTAGKANLYGLITDSAGHRISGVAASLDGIDRQTGVDGYFAFLDVDTGEYLAVFLKGGYEPVALHVDLVEGNNELNVVLGPTGAAIFTYVGKLVTSYSEDRRYLLFEVEIKNTGALSGEVTITANASSAYGTPNITYFLRKETISPGQTVTFSGAIENDDPNGEDPDYWLRLNNVSSEAGIITLEFGDAVGLLSFYVPPQVTSGSEFWAIQTLSLPFEGDRIFQPQLILSKSRSCICSQADIATANYYYRQFTLAPGVNEYEVRGMWENGGAPYPQIVQSPARATYFDYSSGVPEEKPLPTGIYNVLSTLRYGNVVGPDEYAGLWYVWKQVQVGQVEIV